MKEKMLYFLLFKSRRGVEKIAQSITCFLYKHGDLSLIPSTHIKTDGCVDMFLSGEPDKSPWPAA